MASYKLNIARIRGCPSPAEVASALEAYGIPDDQEFGVLNHSAAPSAVFGTIIRRVRQAVQKLNPDTKELTAEAVEKVQVLPFGLHPEQETLELYAGSAAGIQQVADFLSAGLSLPVVVEPIELDLPDAIEKLSKLVQRFVLRSVRITDYTHDSFTCGPYAPKFLDTIHGQEFMEKFAPALVSAAVKFAAKAGRATATLSNKACFSFSCNEEDKHEIQATLRKLA